MTYHVNLVGLIYFHVCETSGELSAFFPDGRNPGKGIPPHVACLFIEEKDHDSDNWWPDYKRQRTLALEPELGATLNVNVFEFELPSPARITFSNRDKKLDSGNVRQVLPGVKELDPDFELDPNAEIIARVPLTGGTLEAQNFEGAAIVRWTIETHAEPITITAQTSEETRQITLKRGTAPREIVFSNTSNLIHEAREKIAVRAAAEAERAKAPAGPAGGVARNAADSSSAKTKEDDHSSIYGKLNKNNRDGTRIAASTFRSFDGLPAAASTHAYLNFLRHGKELPLPKCSPICCSQ